MSTVEIDPEQSVVASDSELSALLARSVVVGPLQHWASVEPVPARSRQLGTIAQQRSDAPVAPAGNQPELE